MPTIIRATDQNRGTHAVAFNFEDMANQAESYLQRVRADAAGILTKAQHEADALRKRAEAEGQRAAADAANRAVDQVIRKQLATVMPALHCAVEDIKHAKQAWLAHWESSAVHVAAAIAARVLRREIAGNPEIPVQLVREALELATGNSHLRIRLNPADLDAIRGQVQLLVSELAPLATAELLADPAISRGGCRVETQFGSIDQQIETQLARIEEELTQ